MSREKSSGQKNAEKSSTKRNQSTQNQDTEQQASDEGGKSERGNVRTVQPEFWDELLDALPPWIDEITGIVLLVFGMISLMALFGVAGDAALAKAWSDALRSLFGYGSVVVAVGIVVAGVLIFLPKVGIAVPLSSSRLLALELAFLSLLAMLHLGTGDEELRALAREGEGGGYIGWGISVIPHLLVGTVISLVFFGLILVISTGRVIGIRSAHLVRLLSRTRDLLTREGEKLAVTPLPKRPALVSKRQRTHTPSTAENAYYRRVQLMRIRPDEANLPPSQRPGAITTAPTRETSSEPETEEAQDEDYQRLARVLRTSAEAETDVGEIKFDTWELIGTLLPRKRKSDPQMVQRPDGRVKHYFSADDMQEPRKRIKREKTLPPLELLQDHPLTPPSEEEINYNVVLIENTLQEFDINVDVVDVKTGPTVTQYAVQPFREVKGEDGEIKKERTRLSKIASLASDLSLSLSVKRLRLETPVPGHSYMGVEVPNHNPSVVALRGVYESKAFYEAWQKARSPLVVPLGRDVAGQPVVADLAEMPHMLLAGTTGSGKSVAIAAIATSLVLNSTPDSVKMVMLDPKMVELPRFNGLPHLLGEVETDVERVIGVLRWCTREMDRRYKLLEENAARNIETYNSRLGQRRKSEHLPYIVIMVDEIGDLMMSKPEETEQAVTRLAQMARAVGMHLIVATQRPSVDVITGLIKANFPARVSFAVASAIDSRVILDTNGAETLIGQGDMLYFAPDAAVPKRLQGCFVADEEVRAVVKHWSDWKEEQIAAGKLSRQAVAPWERGLTRREFLAETDPMLEEAIELVVNDQEASASQIQRRLGLGYPRAARIIDLLAELGVVGEQVPGARSRKVLIEKGKDPFKFILERRQQQEQEQDSS